MSKHIISIFAKHDHHPSTASSILFSTTIVTNTSLVQKPSTSTGFRRIVATTTRAISEANAKQIRCNSTILQTQSCTVTNRSALFWNRKKNDFSLNSACQRRSSSEITGDKSSSASNSASVVRPEVLINQLQDITDRPGAIDHWITNQLNDDQRTILMKLVSEAAVGINSGGGVGGASTATFTFAVPEPSQKDLKLVAFTTAIPFVGFGIMDNSILIIAGDAIDTSLGVTLGISTMCAAAIGNIISDIAGIGLGTAVEDFCALYLKLPIPNITTAQRQLRSVRFANQFGCGVGIVIGCIIGMFPLLYIDSKKVQYKKREAHLDGIFKDVILQAGALVGAARVCLYLRVDDKTNPLPAPDGKYIYIKYDAASAHQGKNTTTISKSTSTNKSTKDVGGDPGYGDVTKQERFIPVGRGIVSRALLTGESWNIVDVQSEPDFDPFIGYVDWEDAVNNKGRKTKTMICVPILDSLGRPIAVIQAVNKTRKGREDRDDSSDPIKQNNPVTSAVDEQVKGHIGQRFTESDVQILKALASHISVSLQRMYEQAEGDEAEVRLHDTIRILKEYGLAGIVDEDINNKRTTTDVRSPKYLSRRPLFPED